MGSGKFAVAFKALTTTSGGFLRPESQPVEASASARRPRGQSLRNIIRKRCVGTRAGRTCYSLDGGERNLKTYARLADYNSRPFLPGSRDHDECARRTQTASDAKRFRRLSVAAPMRGRAIALIAAVAVVGRPAAAQL